MSIIGGGGAVGGEKGSSGKGSPSKSPGNRRALTVGQHSQVSAANWSSSRVETPSYIPHDTTFIAAATIWGGGWLRGG